MGYPPKSKRNGANQGSSKQHAEKNIFSRAKDQVIASTKKRYGGKGGMANIVKDISLLKSLLNVENKHIDTIAGFQTVVTTTSLVYGIGAVAQGSASNQRTGDSIKIDRMDLIMKYFYSTGTAATSASIDQRFRYFVVRYLKTPSSSGTSAFNINDLLNQDSGTNYTAQSLSNTDLSEDFVILKEGLVHIVLPNVPASSASSTAMVELSIPCGFHQTYTGSANTTIVDNMCFVVVVADNAINIGGISGLYISSRMWYIDN
jgi:hypothetical protein